MPGLLDLASYADRAHVIFLVVATLDPESFRGRFAARGREAVERPPHRYLENLDAILRIQDHLLELAELHGVPIVENVSFDRSVHLDHPPRDRDAAQAGRLRCAPRCFRALAATLLLAQPAAAR